MMRETPWERRTGCAVLSPGQPFLDAGSCLAMTDVAIAVDIGGTHIKAALITPAGQVLHRQRVTTGADRGTAVVRETIRAAVASLASAARDLGLTAVGCGLVLPGVIDEQAGVLEWAPNLGLHNVRLRDDVVASIELPTALG